MPPVRVHRDGVLFPAVVVMLNVMRVSSLGSGIAVRP